MMSTTKEPGSQTNPEQEQGVNRETRSTQSSARPVAVRMDQIDIDQVAHLDGSHRDDGNGLAAGSHHGEDRNGVNGVHHTNEHHSDVPQDGGVPQDGVSDESVPASLDGSLSSGTDASDSADQPEAVDETPTLTNGMSTPRSAVKIKGRPGGVSLELGEGVWDELFQLLEERLIAAEGFFRGGRVVLDVGPRPLVEDQLRQVRQLLETHEMQLGVVRSTAERTIQAAAEVGVSTTSEEAQESLHLPEPPLIVEDGPPNAYAPSPYATPEALPTRPVHFVHRGNLRSGQVLRKTESIVVIGDVNPGAQVISGGDIMIWGRLRGMAHAGADGNRRSVVTAIDFVPTQLRIANLTAIAPEPKKSRGVGLLFWKKEPERRPEIARVVDGHIVVEPWDESKPNGMGVWR